MLEDIHYKTCVPRKFIALYQLRVFQRFEVKKRLFRYSYQDREREGEGGGVKLFLIRLLLKHTGRFDKISPTAKLSIPSACVHKKGPFLHMVDLVRNCCSHVKNTNTVPNKTEQHQKLYLASFHLQVMYYL